MSFIPPIPGLKSPATESSSWVPPLPGAVALDENEQQALAVWSHGNPDALAYAKEYGPKMIAVMIRLDWLDPGEDPLVALDYLMNHAT